MKFLLNILLIIVISTVKLLSAASTTESQFKGISYSLNIRGGTTNLTGAAPTYTGIGPGTGLITISANTVLTLVAIPTTGEQRFRILVTGNGSNTLTLSGPSITVRDGTLLTVPINGLTTLEFHQVGATLYLDVYQPVLASEVSAALDKIASATNSLLTRVSTGWTNNSLTIYPNGTIQFPDGIKQIFNPDGTNPGLNAGAQAGNPSSLVNGDIWYDSTANQLKARINGATISLGGATPAIYQSGTLVTISNTVTETDLVSFNVPGNTLSTDKALKVKVATDYFNNSGATRTFTLRVKYGATTLYADTTTTLSASAVHRAGEIAVDLFNRAATGSQGMSGFITFSGINGATTGTGDLGALNIIASTIGGTSAEDSTADKTFKITIEHSLADANLAFVAFHIYAQVVD